MDANELVPESCNGCERLEKYPCEDCIHKWDIRKETLNMEAKLAQEIADRMDRELFLQIIKGENKYGST